MNTLPHLITEIPGPEAQALVARSIQAVSPSLPRAYPLAVKRAQGVMVEDVDGNRFLDCAAGIAVCSTGHCHPRVVQAIQEQAARLVHICGADYYDPMYISFAERLSAMLPGNNHNKVFLGNSGAEAVEAALKLARYHSGRTHIIAFLGAFHGRTMGATSLTASKPIYHAGFHPLLPGITHVPYAYCYRCAFHSTYPSCDFACVAYIEDQIFAKAVDPASVAAVFVEPVQGEGGYIVPPDGWLGRLRELCNRYGILLVADEVQSGIGRTGKMLACEHWDIAPDIVCLAKALGSGMPISAMVARHEVMNWPPGAHGSTYGGNPVCCAAAHATLDVIEQDDLLENATRIGNLLLGRLQELEASSRLIGNVRGLGLMIGVEFVKDKTTKAKARQETERVVRECFRRGLLTLPCGPNSLRFSPPLIITEAQANTALEIFAEAVAAVEQQAFP